MTIATAKVNGGNVHPDFHNADLDHVLTHLTGQAGLPIDQLKLMDRVVTLEHEGGSHGKGKIITEMDIHPDLWFFKCHFPGDPVMPGCLGIECLWQALGLFLALKQVPGKGRALGVGNLKFFGEVLPHAKKVQFHLDVNRVINRKWAVAVADGFVSVDGKTIYEAEQVKVGIFPETEEGFPV